MFTTILVAPLYNAFIFLIALMGGSVGLAIIAMTFLIRIVFYPAFAASIRTQMNMQAVQNDLDTINEKYKDDATERGKQTMALFKEKNIKPFAGLIALIVQIPVFIGLYYAFFHYKLPGIATGLLYSFVHAPENIDLTFLAIDLTVKHNILLTVLVVVTQYAVIHFSFARSADVVKTMTPERQQAHRMQKMFMLYGMPVLLGFIAYSVPAAVSLYFVVGNIISLGQEWLIRRELRKKRS